MLMHEVVYLNKKNMKPKDFESGNDGDRIWHLDNGASNHMTGNQSYFNKIDEKITGKVRFEMTQGLISKAKGLYFLLVKTEKRRS